jgi:hypothetical protein
MSDQDRIFTLYEQNLNQSAIGLMQQRDPNGNLKYRPGEAGPGQSYTRYNVPTTNSAKVKGSPFVPNGISDEETIYVPGYAKMKPSQLKGSIKRCIEEINEAFENGNYSFITSKADLLNLFSDTYSKYLKEVEK